jgi:hypothetical protein
MMATKGDQSTITMQQNDATTTTSTTTTLDASIPANGSTGERVGKKVQ